MDRATPPATGAKPATPTKRTSTKRTPTKRTPTKAALVRTLLGARAGVTLRRLCEATGWQRHSVRAALSRLRKAGYTIERRRAAKAGGEVRYRISGRPEGA